MLLPVNSRQETFVALSDTEAKSIVSKVLNSACKWRFFFDSNWAFLCLSESTDTFPSQTTSSSPDRPLQLWIVDFIVSPKGVQSRSKQSPDYRGSDTHCRGGYDIHTLKDTLHVSHEPCAYLLCLQTCFYCLSKHTFSDCKHTVNSSNFEHTSQILLRHKQYSEASSKETSKTRNCEYLKEVCCQESACTGKGDPGLQIHLRPFSGICIGMFTSLCDLTANADHLSNPDKLQLRYGNLHNLHRNLGKWYWWLDNHHFNLLASGPMLLCIVTLYEE